MLQICLSHYACNVFLYLATGTQFRRTLIALLFSLCDARRRSINGASSLPAVDAAIPRVTSHAPADALNAAYDAGGGLQPATSRTEELMQLSVCEWIISLTKGSSIYCMTPWRIEASDIQVLLYKWYRGSEVMLTTVVAYIAFFRLTFDCSVHVWPHSVPASAP